MTDAIQGLVSEAKRNRFSSIGGSLTDDDVCSVWDNVSSFIEKQMTQQKGVNIPGLGTFTFSQNKLEVGNNKFILTQRPIFSLSEKFGQTHGLTHSKYCVSGQIPVVQLNYSVLAFESPFDRDTVEACVREVLQALSRSIAAKKNIDFAFSGVGRLQIRDSKVKMRFYKEFITSMDGTGKLLDSMKDRPGTIDSVISNRSQTRAISQNTLVLPKILSFGRDRIGRGSAMTPEPEEKNAMPTIDEEEQPDPTEREGPVEEQFHVIDSVPDPVFVTEVRENDDDGMKELLAEFDVEDCSGDAKKMEAPLSRLSANRASMPLAKVNGISLTDDILADAAASHRAASVLSKSPPKPLPKRSLSPIGYPGSAQNPRLSPLNESLDSRRSQSADNFEGMAQKNKLPPPIPRPPSEMAGSPCGHNAGQELCYLCHQRDRRNIPVPLAEERRKQEEAEERALQQFQHLRDMESILGEQEMNLVKRHNDQLVAAFNLGISEALDSKKRHKSMDFHPSYVFQSRPLTPPRFIKQDMYSKDLSDQITSKQHKTNKRKSDEEFLERLEQVQLAEDLAAQREQYLKDKREQQDHYKKALSAQMKTNHATCTSPNDFSPQVRAEQRARLLSLPNPKILLPFACMVPIRVQDGSRSSGLQVRFKPLPLPTAEPDSSEPIFGKDDMNNETMAERRKRANDLYKEQQAIVEKRKRDAILRKLQEQKEAEEMLQRNRKEFIEDRAERYQRSQQIRKQLEDDWARAATNKKHKELEEKDHICSPGQLLTEQFDRYKRCNQCKRRLNNLGESNIWRESHYVPGSRIMV